MSKRIVAVILSVLLMVPVLPAASAAQNVNYAVNAFAAVQASNFFTTALSKGSTRIYGSVGSYTGGYIVTIPANTQSGYLVVAGYLPAMSYTSVSGWGSPPLINYPVPFYVLSSSNTFAPTVLNSHDDGQPFTGVVYVPAHTNTLYLFVYAGQAGTGVYLGAYSASNAFINFVPDTDSSGPLLQQILSQLQDIKSEVTSSPDDNQAAQAIVDQIEQTMEEIEELNKQIEDNTNRPDPDDLLPSAPVELLPPSDDAAVAGYEAVSSILASPLMLSLLVMVFTLAFVRYVLFGKHDG